MRLDRNLLRSPATTKAWLILTAVLMSCLLPTPAEIPTAAPQIQGANLRVEFDNHLRSRVIALFDNKETVLGAFTASETLTTTGKVWTEFVLTSQKQGPIKDAFGEGKRLTIEGKAGALKKSVSVTVYDNFPTMAFFDVQYTNTGRTELAVKSWTNNAYTISAQPGQGQHAPVLVLPEWLVREASQLGLAAARQFSAGELSGHECQRLRRRYADCRRLAA